VAVATRPRKARRVPMSPARVMAAKLSPQHFLGHCMIQDGDGGPAIPFRLWGFQADVIRDIETHARLIFLKARQLGLSWLTLAYILWLCSCNEGQTALILNRGLRESEELLERIKFMIKRLPPELRPQIVKENNEQIQFANGSRIFSLTATEYAGSGITAQFVMVDEWAKIKGIAKILVSLLPTLSAGGKMVGISTAVGYHNAFAKEWRRAIDGKSRFFPVYIPWHAHPGRDEAWYQEKREELATERDLLQEYPGDDWRDAFQLPGESVFRDEFDRKRHVTQTMPDPKSQWPKHRGIDFGFHHAIHLWAEIQGKRNVLVFAELHAEKETTVTMMQQVVARDAELGVKTGEAPAGCDPAGKAQMSNATESEHYTVERFGIPVVWEQVAPKDRVQQIKQLLKENRLLIHSSCDFLIEALEQAQWAKAPAPSGSQSSEPAFKESYEKDHVYEHPLDTLGYLLITVFPVMGSPAAARTTAPRGGGRRNQAYSSSEYG
jgi:hypothetical protein